MEIFTFMFVFFSVKDFLRSLPECVLTESCVPEWVRLYDLNDSQLQLKTAKECVVLIQFIFEVSNILHTQTKLTYTLPICSV
jgi:hypothetical protein